MACHHKFKEYLTLDKLDFEPNTLIVGTFNPDIEGNAAEWFYGRAENNFWDVLPRLYGAESMRHANPIEWKAFCSSNKIAITDLIQRIDDADLNNKTHLAKLKTYSDKSIATSFQDHSYVDLVKLLKNRPTIKHIYLTRGIGETFWRRAWRPVQNYARENNLLVQNLITPSGYAFYQQGRYNKLNSMNPLSLEDFIYRDWRSKWHF
ncbi:hypothetical protein MM236_18895 [Belliella sp. DSM 107340]|uniref:G/U mismatch-specific uracil-DNA glycosylase n=1 Tax=Belliella calami TaxID=2923436 RepID=A0ABS9UTX0_9BACT|nr:hypothetical protein [Belliella calami]MCH7400070.1 hypothetical protein [Belliella calami]